MSGDYRQKGRAVFLAAIMLTSMVAMSVAFVGPAAALGDANVELTDVTVSENTTTNDAGIYNITTNITGNAIDSNPINNISVNLSAGGNNQPDLTGITADNITIYNESGSFGVDSVNLSTTGGNQLGNATGASSDILINTSTSITAGIGDNVTVEIGDQNTGVQNGPNANTPTDVGITFADQGVTGPNNEDGDSLTGAYELDPSIEVSNLDISLPDFNEEKADFVPDNADINLTATVENVGAQDGVNYNASVQANDTTLDVAGNNDQNVSGQVGGSAAFASGSLDAGDTENIEVQVNSTAYVSNGPFKYGELIQHGLTLNDASTSGAEGIAGTNLVIGNSNELGEITVQVEDQATGDELEADNIELYLNSQSFSEDPVREVTDTDRTTFSGLAMNTSSPGVNYKFRVPPSGDFESGSDSVELIENTRDSPVRSLALARDVNAEVLGLGLWDAEEEEIVDDTSSLFANGEFDNQVEFAVFSQTGSSSEDFETISDNNEVSVDVETGANDGVVTQFIVDNQTAETNASSIQLTLNGSSPTANVDGNSTTGDFSYETFNITANATDVVMENQGEFLVDEFLNASTTDINNGNVDIDPDLSGQQITTTSGENVTNDITFVREGEQAVTGDVREITQNGSTNLDGVTVWAAYDSLGDESLDEIESTFVNDVGESFLVAESTDDGYAIDGLAGEETQFNLYATYDDTYNTVNLSDTDVDAFVAAYQAGLNTTNQTPGTVTQDLYVDEEDIVFDYNVDVEVQDPDTGDFVKAADVPIQSDTEVRINATRAPQDAVDPDFSAAANQEVDVELTDSAAGSLTDTTVETDADGLATTTFTAGTSDEDTNVSASTENIDGDEYVTETGTGQGLNDDSNQAEINVFGVGQITGDVVDAEDTNIPGASVTLYERNESGEFTRDENDVLETTATGAEGSYSFVDIQSGNDYQIVAETDGTTGFAEVTDLGTGTTNADVVIEDIVVSGFTASDLEPSEAEVEPNEVLDEVSANLTNNVGEQSTQEIELRITDDAGDTVASVTQDVTLDAGETDSVTFEDVEAPAEEGSYEHGIFPAEGSEVTGTLDVTVEDDGGNSADRPASLPETVSTDAFNAVDSSGDGALSPSEIALAISENSNEGNVGGVEISPSEFALMISWNADQ